MYKAATDFNSQEADTLKKALLIALLLVAFVLLATVHQDSIAASAPGCGQLVYGHTQPGGQPTGQCADDGRPIFHAGDHIYSDTLDICPIDGAALVSGHAPY